MSKTRNIRRSRNSDLLRDQCFVHGIQVKEFNQSHLRLIGKCTVDYWPGTGRAWETHTKNKSLVLHVEHVVRWVSSGIHPKGKQKPSLATPEAPSSQTSVLELTDEQREHMRSI